MKTPDSTPSEIRLLVVAFGGSVLLHAALFGGWAAWEKFRPGSDPAAGQAMEIKVRLVPADAGTDETGDPNPDRYASGPAPIDGVEVTASATAEPDKRASSDAGLRRAVPAKRLLSDPATGLVFSVYFKAVKAKLAREAEAGGAGFEEDVTVHFVLSRTGELEAVSTPPGTSLSARSAALRLLSAAAPFPSFPSSIRHASIAFEVLFRRDASVLR